MWHLKIETAACQKVVYDHARKSICCSVYIWICIYNMYIHIHIFVYVSFINVHKYIVHSTSWLSHTYHLQVETAAYQKEVYHEDLLRCIYMHVYVCICINMYIYTYMYHLYMYVFISLVYTLLFWQTPSVANFWGGSKLLPFEGGFIGI